MAAPWGRQFQIKEPVMRKCDERPKNGNAQSGVHAGDGGEEKKAVPFYRAAAFSVLLYHVLYLITLDTSINRPGFPMTLWTLS
jgi:hypothetical protein